MNPSRFLFQIALLISLLAGIENPSAQSGDKSAPAPAAQCNLTIEQAPALFGIRLGMTHEEAKATAPGLGLGRKIRKENGISTSLTSRPGEEAEGVINSYLDDKLFEINVLFGSKMPTKNTAEFVVEFSKKFNLPQQAWQKKSAEDRYSLVCSGFTIEASEQNQIVITDSAAKSELKKRAGEIALLRQNN